MLKSTKMATRWSEAVTLKLIALYKSYDFLWNKNTDLYRSVPARKHAYDEIVAEMDLPGLTSQDVRCKIKNLRTSYYQELRKMASYKAKNKPVKPVKWFVAFKSIMGGVTFDGSESKLESNTDSEDYEEEEEQSNQIEESLFQEESTSNSDAYVVSIKQEFLDEMNNISDKVIPPTICDYLEPVAAKRKKTEEETTPTGSKRSKNRDEFQMFANNIAQQLRKLPLNRALNLQIEVQKMIAKERIDTFKKQVEMQKDDEDSSQE